MTAVCLMYVDFPDILGPVIMSMLLPLCACGGSSYGVKTVQTLVEQDYSLAFRKGDTVATYVAATIVALAQLLRLILLFGGRRRRD